VLDVAVAEALEGGTVDGALARWVERVWARTAQRRIVRPLVCPPHVRSVTVGGATLGGSGKTPLAIACAAHLAACGARVAVVGHGYRARPLRARVVRVDDRVDEVGDEALLAARSFHPVCGAGDDAGAVSERACVVVGPTRVAALGLAVRLADVVVFDGVAQTQPRPAALALLAVDPSEPWGHAVAGPPRGDLVAPRAALLAACDAVVPVGYRRGGPPDLDPGEGREGVPRPVWPATPASRGAWLDERTHTRSRSLLTWAELRGLRVGFVSAIARPVRVVRGLFAQGVQPCVQIRARDHGPIDAETIRACRAAAARLRLDLWMATPKCALHLESVRTAEVGRGVGDLLGARLATLEHSIALSPALCARLRALVAS
jgi:tetraacyldisaccharide 4'-kinase